MEISMDCPVCDGRLVFRSSNPRLGGATTGRCGLCRTRFTLAGGALDPIEPGDRSRRQRDLLMDAMRASDPTASLSSRRRSDA